MHFTNVLILAAASAGAATAQNVPTSTSLGVPIKRHEPLAEVAASAHANVLNLVEADVCADVALLGENSGACDGSDGEGSEGGAPSSAVGTPIHQTPGDEEDCDCEDGDEECSKTATAPSGSPTTSNGGPPASSGYETTSNGGPPASSSGVPGDGEDCDCEEGDEECSKTATTPYPTTSNGGPPASSPTEATETTWEPTTSNGGPPASSSGIPDDGEDCDCEEGDEECTETGPAPTTSNGGPPASSSGIPDDGEDCDCEEGDEECSQTGTTPYPTTSNGGPPASSPTEATETTWEPTTSNGGPPASSSGIPDDGEECDCEEGDEECTETGPAPTTSNGGPPASSPTDGTETTWEPTTSNGGPPASSSGIPDDGEDCDCEEGDEECTETGPAPTTSNGGPPASSGAPPASTSDTEEDCNCEEGECPTGQMRVPSEDGEGFVCAPASSSMVVVPTTTQAGPPADSDVPADENPEPTLTASAFRASINSLSLIGAGVLSLVFVF